ncbi:hypothetical protein, partial [Achromobacter xylosoxidans]|uniref:hypothetical protein n=1 Tax=Alcaligenes xylosoxydans xylosoxydans TaxID=85698 RepID=UPI001F13E45D
MESLLPHSGGDFRPGRTKTHKKRRISFALFPYRSNRVSGRILAFLIRPAASAYTDAPSAPP